MKLRSLVTRSTLGLLFIVSLASVANLAYEYKNYSLIYGDGVKLVPDVTRPLETRQLYQLLNQLNFDSPGPTFTMAGFPAKYYVRSEVADAPPVTTWSLAYVGINLFFWSVLLAGVWLYDVRTKRKQKLETEAKRGIALADLLVVIALAAVVFAYWNRMDRQITAQRTLVGTIQSSGGNFRYTRLLPKFYGPYLPEWFGSRYDRISKVQIEKPSAELVKEIIEQPQLQQLEILGGDFPSELVDEIAKIPLLWHLTLAGRELTPQNVASLSSLGEQLIVLDLLRTNISTQGVMALGEMPRLSELVLSRTNLRLADLGTPAWAQNVKSMCLPHPGPGQSDSLTLDGWPELELLEISEWDELANPVAVTLNFANLPKLREIRLDLLQKFDLDLKNLAGLELLTDRRAQVQVRVLQQEDIPAALWLGKLNVSNVPNLPEISAWGTDLNQIYVERSPQLELFLTTNYFGEQATPSFANTWPEEDAKPEPPPSPGERATRQKWIDDIGGSRELRSLILTDVDMRGVDLSPLTENPTLEFVNLSNTRITNELAGLAGETGFHELRLNGIPMDGKQIAWLTGKLPNLTNLLCDSDQVTKLRLRDNATLQQIFADSENVPYQLQALELVNMLSLKENFNLPPGLQYCKIENNPALRGVSFRSPLPAGSVLTGFRDLEHFAGGGPILDDQLVDELASCTQLKHLVLAYAAASPEALAALGNLPLLETLSLTGCQVNDATLSELAANTRLKTLILDGTAITPQSLTSIMAMRSLEELSISNTPAAAGDLSGLASLAELKQLGIGGTTLTVPVADALAQLKRLQSLDMSGGDLTNEGLTQFSNTRPESLQLLILRDINAPDARLQPMVSYINQVDITNSLFEVSSMDRLIASGKIIDTQQRCGGMSALQFSMMRSGYGNRIEMPKPWDISSAAFNPNPPQQNQNPNRPMLGGYGSSIQYGSGAYGGGGYGRGTITYGSDSYGPGAYGSGSYSLGGDISSLGGIAKELGYAIGRFWSQAPRELTEF